MPRNRLLILLFFFLYAGQGLVLGLAYSLPTLFLQQAPLTPYSILSMLSLVMYPFSFKVLWSPIVDTIHSDRMGRRMSWILPLQIVLTMLSFAISSEGHTLFDSTEVNIKLVGLIFSAVLVCATQDIAVDALVVEALPSDETKVAFMLQNLGQLLGGQLWSVYFFFGGKSGSAGYFSLLLQGLTAFHCLSLLIVAIVFFKLDIKSEHLDSNIEEVQPLADEVKDARSIREGFSIVTKDVKDMLDHLLIKRLMFVLAIHILPFLASYSLNTELLKIGIGADTLSVISMVTLPFSLAMNYFAHYFIDADQPLRMWYPTHLAQGILCAFTPFILYFYNSDGPNSYIYWISVTTLVVALRECATFSVMSMFSTFAYLCKVELSTSSSTGTQMTLLNSLFNFCRSSASTLSAVILHGLLTYGGSTHPYYLLSAISLIVGLIVNHFFIAPNVSAINNVSKKGGKKGN